MHPLGQLITDRMDHPQNRWSLADVVKRMQDAGHHNIGKSRLGQLRRDPVDSIKGEVIFALADGLGVTPLTVANAALESMGIATRPAEVTDAIATISIDPSLSDTSRRALIALVREMRQDPLRDQQLAGLPTAPVLNEIQKKRQARRPTDVDEIVDVVLLQHYAEMHGIARRHAHQKVLADQAWMRLGDDRLPNVVFVPEIDDILYVQYVAARLSTEVQGGDPDLHAVVSLSDEEYEAAERRFNREFAEMVAFGRLRTAGAPHPGDYTAPRKAAARKAPNRHRIGQSVQGDADGEENQDSGAHE